MQVAGEPVPIGLGRRPVSGPDPGGVGQHGCIHTEHWQRLGPVPIAGPERRRNNGKTTRAEYDPDAPEQAGIAPIQSVETDAGSEREQQPGEDGHNGRSGGRQRHRKHTDSDDAAEEHRVPPASRRVKSRDQPHERPP